MCIRVGTASCGCQTLRIKPVKPYPLPVAVSFKLTPRSCLSTVIELTQRLLSILGISRNGVCLPCGSCYIHLRNVVSGYNMYIFRHVHIADNFHVLMWTISLEPSVPNGVQYLESLHYQCRVKILPMRLHTPLQFPWALHCLMQSHLQCCAVVIQLIFSKILTIDTPYLTLPGEVWGF